MTAWKKITASYKHQLEKMTLLFKAAIDYTISLVLAD